MTATEIIRVTRTTARLSPVGESHGRCTHSDQVVHAARRLRASGARLREVAAITGCSISTAWRWTHGHRPEPTRIVVKRVRETDQQSVVPSRTNGAPGGRVGGQQGTHTPIGRRGEPPETTALTAGATTPGPTPDLDFSELA